MTRPRKILLACILVVVALPASAGRIEDIIASVKAECRKDITSEEAVRHVKTVYVSCIPGGTADLGDGCQIKCKRQSGGGVLGR
jgi:hypothetical protein